MKRIIVLGGGYGGILTAKKLAKKLKKQDVKITLIDKNPYHTMLTELHEVAAGRVHEDSIKIYFDQVFAGRNVDVEMDEITNIDFSNNILTSETTEYPYDYLVVGTGCKPTFFGNDQIKENVFTLWSLEDANILKEQIHTMFKEAAKTKDEALRKELLSFVVVGAGFTGVEMAGELAEQVPELCHDYRINQEEVTVKLLDMAPRVLPVFPEKLSANADKKLRKLGVEIHTGEPCGEITKESIKYGEQVFKSRTVVWVTGVEGSELMDNIEGVETKARGRIACNQYLQAEGKENVYVVGDNIFYIPEGEERPVPQMVENAEHSAGTVAKNIASEFKGKEKESYNPSFHGAMVCIGGRKGLAQVGSGNMMFNIKNSFIALFIKHFINIVYFFQVLGWTKVWSYIKHEFFNVPNDRSMVGGLLSRKTPNIWTVPLRIWLGISWFLQGLPKLTEKLTGGWADYCTLGEFPRDFENKGLLCQIQGEVVNEYQTDVSIAAPEDPVIVEHNYEDLHGFELVMTYITDFFKGFAPTNYGWYGSEHDIPYILEYFQQYKWIGWLFWLIEWAYDLFIVIADWSMNTIVAYFAPLFELVLAVGETGVGILLIIGLFTSVAALGSLVLTIMVLVGSSLAYDGIVLTELFWYLVGSIALLNFGGSGNVVSVDYYIMPKVRAFWQKIPLVKKWYTYGEKIQ
ncbi:FAD-dependent oxidoreductase [Haloplasma contractile]|uniref:NADH:ubiquinone reductase (non-electrogenic) n=1 Tax=Haloplasma contractile SSD-17B TaxID=1033810 RepID=F7PT00_9MOLU|nr:FAD-dependent oxidoreductase [Haloplasma contractile]ERJ12588.1 NADH dehydrogenase protein [Haloplasma contractile SSD-17B]